MHYWIFLVLLTMVVMPAYAADNDPPCMAEVKKATGLNDLQRWQGNWSKPQFDYAVKLQGDQIILETEGDYKDGRLDPIRAECKFHGTFATCKWSSNPSYKDPGKSCIRGGIGALYLVGGPDRPHDQIQGCFVEQASDCQSKGSAGMVPGAQWDMTMPRTPGSTLP